MAQYLKNKIKNSFSLKKKTILILKKKIIIKKKPIDTNTNLTWKHNWSLQENTQETPKLKTLDTNPSPLSPLPFETISSGNSMQSKPYSIKKKKKILILYTKILILVIIYIHISLDLSIAFLSVKWILMCFLCRFGFQNFRLNRENFVLGFCF